MELKDIVLSTLAEIDGDAPDEEKRVLQNELDTKKESIKDDTLLKKSANEEQFIKNLRERILVLFEGFKSPNTQNIEAKLDLTLNFLEYLLSTIDERLDEIKK